MAIHQCSWETPLGWLTAREHDGYITEISWCRTDCHPEEDNALLCETRKQIDEYMAGKRQVFELPVRPDKGTDFQRAVWDALYDIPYGETRNYADVARHIGRPRATRAVGMANHCNPTAIIVPCHRVVGSNGKLTGYAGGLKVKEGLLNIEAKL